MEKIFNWISIVAGLVGGIIANALGGFDGIMIALISVVVLDYLTGVVKAIYTKKLSSEIGFKGIAKKIFIFLIVALACLVQDIIGDSIPVREIVIMFYIANEGISIIENCAEVIPVPEKLRTFFYSCEIKQNKTMKTRMISMSKIELLSVTEKAKQAVMTAGQWQMDFMSLSLRKSAPNMRRNI